MGLEVAGTTQYYYTAPYYYGYFLAKVSFSKQVAWSGAVLNFQALIVCTIIVMASKMDESSSTDVFPHLVLGSMMTGIEHELLTKKVKIKPPTFQSTESEEAFEFIIDYCKWFHKMGIVKKQGIEFVTFILEKNIEQWWRVYAKSHSRIFPSLT